MTKHTHVVRRELEPSVFYFGLSKRRQIWVCQNPEYLGTCIYKIKYWETNSLETVRSAIVAIAIAEIEHFL